MPISEKNVIQYNRCPLLKDSPLCVTESSNVNTFEKTSLIEHFCKRNKFLFDNLNEYLYLDECLSLSNQHYIQTQLHYKTFTITPDLIFFNKKDCHIYWFTVGFKHRSDDILQLTFQKNIVEQCGFTVSKLCIVTVNQHYTKGCSSFLFRELNMNQQCNKKVKKINKIISHLSKPRSIQYVELDYYCFKPYPCTKLSTCWPDHNQWDIFSIYHLPFKKKLSLYKKNIKSYSDIQAHNYPLNSLQLKQKNVSLKKISFVNQDSVSQLLSRLKYPLQCFDLEVAQFINPLFNGEKPFSKLPFLYSILSVDKQLSTLTKKEHLFLPNKDFRKDFTKQLISDLSTQSSIIVFDTTLEKCVLYHLAYLYPEFKQKLLAIINCIIDISPLFINHQVILPEMKGKSSLKAVLKSLKCNISYDASDIQSGLEAVHCYKDIVFNANTEIETKIKKLKQYCALDTQALVEILRFLIYYK